MASSSASKEDKILTFVSMDDKYFTVKESVAVQAPKIKDLLEAFGASAAIPLSNLSSKTLAMVLEYLNKHGDSTVSEDEKKNFDSEFVKKKDDDLIFLLSAARDLEISSLLDLVSQTVVKLYG